MPWIIQISSSPSPIRKSLEKRTLMDKTIVTMLSLLLGSTVLFVGLMFLIPSKTFLFIRVLTSPTQRRTWGWPLGLIKKMGFCLFYSYPKKKKEKQLDPLKSTFVFSFILWAISLWASSWNDFNQATGSNQFQSTKNTIIRKKNYTMKMSF